MSDPRSPEPKEHPGPGGADPRAIVPASVLEPVRCRAHTSAGSPCRKFAIVGGFVCATHGGSAPQVRRAANERLLALAPRAVQVMAGLMEAAESEPVRLKAATEILDRGIGKAVDVTLDITPERADGPTALDVRIAAALAARGLGLGDQDVIDLPSEETGPDQGEHGTSEP